MFLCGPKVELSEMEMENTPEPHNFVTIHDWDFSMGGRIQIDNSSDQESAISGSPTENITGNYLSLPFLKATAREDFRNIFIEPKFKPFNFWGGPE